MGFAIHSDGRGHLTHYHAQHPQYFGRAFASLEYAGTYTDSHSHSDGDTYGNTDSDTNGHTYADRYANTYPNRAAS